MNHFATHAGFTGTRRGMTDAQRATVRQLLVELEVATLTHGDCLGADADAHDLARSMPWPIRIRVRPCTITRMRAYTQGDEAFDPMPPLPRNRLIVDDSAVLIATPAEYQEITRSGTWSTVRYAERRGRKVALVYPDGQFRIGRWRP